MFVIDTQWQDTDASVHTGPRFVYDDPKDGYRYFRRLVRSMSSDRHAVTFCTIALTTPTRTFVSYYKES